MLESHYLWLFCALTALGAFTQGFAGLGFGIVILAGMSFTPWNFERASVVVNLLVLVIHLSVILASRKEYKIRWNQVWLVILGLVVGVPLGYWFILALGSRPIFAFIFGFSLTAFGVNELVKPRINRLPHFMGFPAGIIGGFLGGAFTTSAPPVAIYIYSQDSNPVSLKATLQIIFMGSTLWRLFNIIVFGPGITRPVLEVSAVGLLFVAVFAYAGHRLSRKVSSRLFLRAVYGSITFAGLANLVRSFI